MPRMYGPPPSRVVRQASDGAKLTDHDIDDIDFLPGAPFAGPGCAVPRPDAGCAGASARATTQRC